ncbi:MAG: S8 family serine peptidase [Deinococcales bacterium]
MFLSSCNLEKSQTLNNHPSEDFSYITSISIDAMSQKPEVEKAYSAKIISWHPESGFAVIASNSASAIATTNTTTELNSDAIKASVMAAGSSVWGGGISAWSSGSAVWGGGSSAWGGGVNQSFILANESTWSRINLFAAHALTSKLGSGIKVAVIDTGVDLYHPILSNQLAPATEWWDFVDNDALPQEVAGGAGYGHGTATAGLILQVAPQAKILPLRVLDSNGIGDLDDVIAAIDYALSKGAQIINLSLGTNVYSWPLQQMVGYASDRGAYMIASAGNTGAFDQMLFPAKMTYWTDNNIVGHLFAIGSLTTDDSISSFSATGWDMFAYAPGESLRTAYPDNRLVSATGTSFAAPLYSGAIALMLAEMTTNNDRTDINGYLIANLNRDNIYDRFYAGGTTWMHGQGILDIHRLLFGLKLKNGSFERGNLDGWTTQNANVVVDGSINGFYTARINGQGIISQTIYGLQPNTTYVFKGFLGAQTAGEYGWMGIKNYGGTEIKYKMEYLQHKTLSFTTGKRNTSATIYFSKDQGTGIAIVDEAVVLPIY